MNNRCNEIVANVKMEECYSGLSLVFDGNETLRTEISDAINTVTAKTKMTPDIFDNSQNPISLIHKLTFKPIIYTSITTVVGFLSLNFSDTPPFRIMGTYSAIAVIISAFLSLFLLPSLLEKWQKRDIFHISNHFFMIE